MTKTYVVSIRGQGLNNKTCPRAWKRSQALSGFRQGDAGLPHVFSSAIAV